MEKGCYNEATFAQQCTEYPEYVICLKYHRDLQNSLDPAEEKGEK